MLILILFSFLGGIVTILSPCILPILPVVLSSSVTGGKARPLGVMTGFILSFTFFTLFLASIVRATGISADALRIAAVVIVLLFGLSYLISPIQRALETALSRLANLAPHRAPADGFVSGILVGLSLGLVWTPCVGPILASIIALAATSTVGIGAVLVTLSYALGTAIPLTAIILGGRKLLDTHPWLIKNSQTIQKIFGVLMILTAVAIFMNWDRAFQSYILERFPSYGAGLTKLEDNALVKQRLDDMKKSPTLTDMLSINARPAPELIPGGKWFNLPGNRESLTLSELRGKVVLIDFWTYTCINCIRTLPYIKAWNEKYKDKGLVVIGVHTPEFAFEKNPDNVARAIKDFGITYPVMQDNDYATWQAYDNQYWPAKYFIDKNGKVRDTHFGEGNYDESEAIIQKLLKETGQEVDIPINNQNYQVYARTPETYVGYSRMAGFASPERINPDKATTYSLPTPLSTNEFALGGTWVVGAEYAMPQTGASLSFHFNAKNVYLVMRPHTTGITAKIKVTLDGKDVSNATGIDVKTGIVTVDTDRLYTLINLIIPGDHLLKLEFLDANVELYAFTFG